MVGWCVGWVFLLLLLCFGFFFLDSLKLQFAFFKRKRWKDLPIAWMSECVLGSCFVWWSQVEAEFPPRAEFRLHPWRGAEPAAGARPASPEGCVLSRILTLWVPVGLAGVSPRSVVVK